MERTFTVTVDVPEVIAHTDDWRLQQIIAKAIEGQLIRPKTAHGTAGIFAPETVNLTVKEINPHVAEVEEIEEPINVTFEKAIEGVAEIFALYKEHKQAKKNATKIRPPAHRRGFLRARVPEHEEAPCRSRGLKCVCQAV